VKFCSAEYAIFLFFCTSSLLFKFFLWDLSSYFIYIFFFFYFGVHSIQFCVSENLISHFYISSLVDCVFRLGSFMNPLE
jgi:hypothetical protein